MTYFSKATEDEWKYRLPDKPNAEGHLDAAPRSQHRIYWHEYGNPEGEPVLFLHGGPGGVTSPGNARFFSPERYRILVFDQRGCGRSTPNAAIDPGAALNHNTTQDLIADIELLRRHMQVKDRFHIFGGSWGSTLALAYAIAHPEQVRTLILRGIFLCRRKDLDYFYQGNAATYHLDPYDTRLAGAYLAYPEAWKKFVEIIPQEERGDMVKAYSRIFAMQPKNVRERTRQDEAAFAWSIWEGTACFLSQDLSNLGSFSDPQFARAFARIENHYFMNGAFLGGEGEAARDNNYLLENVGKIARIPVHVVHGQYDEVCPRFQADALVAALRSHGTRVNYVLTPAGHAALERETMKALVQIMDTLPAQ